MKNELVGLIFSHIHVRDNELYKFDILNYNIEYFKKIYDSFFICISGHGCEIPLHIKNKVNSVYWEDTIDNNEIGRGHPKFCVASFKDLQLKGINKVIKTRFCDLITNKELLNELLQSNKIILSEQTCMDKRMIGDLLMLGPTSKLLDIWNYKWNYDKSGLYNLYDSIEKIAANDDKIMIEFLNEQCLFVDPQDIGWHTLEANWNSQDKKPSEEFNKNNLWGAKQGYPYYGGF